MILESREVTKKYGSKNAVNQVSLQLEPGLVYAMLGPNGSGKTTWMKMVAGHVKPTNGEILYQGTPIGKESKNSCICYTFQFVYEMTGNYQCHKIGRASCRERV